MDVGVGVGYGILSYVWTQKATSSPSAAAWG